MTIGLTLVMTVIFEFSCSYVILTKVRCKDLPDSDRVTSDVGVPSTHLVSVRKTWYYISLSVSLASSQYCNLIMFILHNEPKQLDIKICLFLFYAICWNTSKHIDYTLSKRSSSCKISSKWTQIGGLVQDCNIIANALEIPQFSTQPS